MDSFLTPEQEAASPNTSYKRLEELAYESDDLALLVAQNLQTPANLIEKLACLYSKELYVERRFIPNPKFNLDILRVITNHPNTSFRRLLLLGSDFPQEMLDNPVFNLSLLENSALINIIPYHTLQSLWTLEIVPSFVKQAILNHKENCQIINIAKQPNLPLFILEVLIQHKCLQVRCEVAKNPDTPISILEILAQDADVTVRSEVAKNRYTPSNLLEILAHDINGGVRWNVAEHPNTPVRILKIFAYDAAENVRRAVANRFNTPVSVLEILAYDANEYVRYDVAHHLHTPVRILEILAQDDSEMVRRVVAERFDSPFYGSIPF
ncbi:hypothetical protein C7H19_14795 [Aphanothece hegewaldii CCALA 016]|uniref:Leucine rich repeat variant n=1 Tax=Aphanothece hegewaldii CCALA 016 TaxID=2107694 RepID=A0A2T1LW56_9CHRO|nr:hypothetical protein [Aphanothece hegewaldii]PSF36010.1 hypothetical protein C7H19_14795 [Aphanothece hegewaldii CCALA 016]